MKPELSVVGLDLAKSVFYLVGMDERGKIIFRKRLARGEVMPFMAQLPVFSANNPPAHGHETGRKSFPGAGL